MSNFILKWRDPDEDSKSSRIWLTGPFPSKGTACEWARKDETDNGDMRWQLVILPFEALAKSVEITIEAPIVSTTYDEVVADEITLTDEEREANTRLLRADYA